MSRRVLWRSWCKLEAGFELERLRGKSMRYQWVNAHKILPRPNDIWLTTNGYDYKNGPFKKVSLYAESYIYLRKEYDRWKGDRRWDHRFHFNPHYASHPNCTLQNIACWWLREMDLYERLLREKHIRYQFGMVLGKKGKPVHGSDLGWFRSQVVDQARNRSFRYYGTNWPKGDPNYGGEKYIQGHRGTPVKFHDARHLMSDVKFVFVLENTHDKHYSVNYLTEKIFHAFLSRSVPIYAGAWNARDLLGADLFVDIRKFGMSVVDVMDHCEKMPDSEYKGYLDRIEEFLRGPGRAFSCDQRFVELDTKLWKIFR